MVEGMWCGRGLRGPIVKGATSLLLVLLLLLWLLVPPRRWLISLGLEGDERSGEPWRSADVLGGEGESRLELDLVGPCWCWAVSDDWRG